MQQNFISSEAIGQEKKYTQGTKVSDFKKRQQQLYLINTSSNFWQFGMRMITKLKISLGWIAPIQGIKEVSMGYKNHILQEFFIPPIHI